MILRVVKWLLVLIFFLVLLVSMYSLVFKLPQYTPLTSPSPVAPRPSQKTAGNSYVINVTASDVLRDVYSRKFKLVVDNGSVHLVESKNGTELKWALVKALELDAWNVTPKYYGRLLDLFRILNITVVAPNATYTVRFNGSDYEYPDNYTCYVVGINETSLLLALEKAYPHEYTSAERRNLTYPPAGVLRWYYVVPIRYDNFTVAYGFVEVNSSVQGVEWILTFRPYVVVEVWNGSAWEVIEKKYASFTDELRVNMSLPGLYELHDSYGEFTNISPLIRYDVAVRVESSGSVSLDRWDFNITMVFTYDTVYQVGLLLESKRGRDPFYRIVTNEPVEYKGVSTTNITSKDRFVVFNFTATPTRNETYVIDVFVGDNITLLGIKIDRWYHVGSLTVFVNRSVNVTGSLVTVNASVRVENNTRGYPPWINESLVVPDKLAESLYIFEAFNESFRLINESAFERYLMIVGILETIRPSDFGNYVGNFSGRDLLEALYEKKGNGSAIDELYALALRSSFYVNTTVRTVDLGDGVPRTRLVNLVLVRGCDKSALMPPHIVTDAEPALLNIPRAWGGEFYTWIYYSGGKIKPVLTPLPKIGDEVTFERGRVYNCSILSFADADVVTRRIVGFNSTYLAELFESATNYRSWKKYVSR